MRKLPYLTAVMAFCATPAEAEPVYRDLPKSLNECAAETVQKFAPANAAINSFEKEDKGVITHEFEAEVKNSNGEQSLRIVIYPYLTGAGTLNIISRERSETMNVFAYAVMDREYFKWDGAVMSIDSKGPQADKGDEIVSQRISGAIGALNACAPEPAQ